MEWLWLGFLLGGLIVVVLIGLLARRRTDAQGSSYLGSRVSQSDASRQEHNARIIERYRNRRLSNSGRSSPSRDTAQNRRRWL